MVPAFDLQSRFHFEFVGELGIHPRARARKCLKNQGSFQRAVHQHPTGRMGSLATGLAPLDHQNRRATLAQNDRQREADDAPAYDDHIGSLHTLIVKELKSKYSRLAGFPGDEAGDSGQFAA